jgi:hypothetical protein
MSVQAPGKFRCIQEWLLFGSPARWTLEIGRLRTWRS